MKEDICLIVGGAKINNYEGLQKAASTAAFCIYCDSGQKHSRKLGRKPDLIVGDFDSSLPPGGESGEVIWLPREKDDTDTMFAVKEGLSRGYRNFLLLGAAGERLDHTLVNVYALLYLKRHGAKGCLIDDWSFMELVGEEPAGILPDVPWFSLVAVCGRASGIRIRDAKYELEDGVVESEYQYAVSNETLPGKTATVSVKNGTLLLIRGR